MGDNRGGGAGVEIARGTIRGPVLMVEWRFFKVGDLWLVSWS